MCKICAHSGSQIPQFEATQLKSPRGLILDWIFLELAHVVRCLMFYDEHVSQ